MVFVNRWRSILLLLLLLAGCGGATPAATDSPPTAPVAQATAVPATPAASQLPPTEGPAPTAVSADPTPAEPTASPAGQPAPAAIGGLALIEQDGSVVVIDGDSRTKVGLVDPNGLTAEPTCNTITDLAWSPDGHRLAFQGRIVTLGEEPAVAPIGGYHVRWSPDGTKLAYITGYGEDADILVVAEQDGFNPQEIGQGHWSQTGYPNWSPDGKLVVAGKDLRLDDPASSDVMPPAEFGDNGAWSPDGKLFVWTDASESDPTKLRLRVKAWDGAQELELAVLQFERDPAAAENDIWWTAPVPTLPPLVWFRGENILLSIPSKGLRNIIGTYLIQPDGRYGPLGNEKVQLCDLSPDGKQLLGRRVDNSHIVVFDLTTFTDGVDLGPGVTARWRPTPQGPVPAAPLAEASPTLSLAEPRAEGPAVREIQTILEKLGYLKTVDGVFGPDTEAAVRAFQERNLVEVDGIVGPDTWSALRYKLACPAEDDPNGPGCFH